MVEPNRRTTVAINTIVARTVTADPRRVRGALRSRLAKAPSVEEIDAAIGAAMQGRLVPHARKRPRR